MEPVIERFEAVNLLAHRLWDPAGFLPDSDVNVGREKAEHPPLSEATPEGADRVGMGRRFVRALLGGPIGEQREGADHLSCSGAHSAVGSTRREAQLVSGCGDYEEGSWYGRPSLGGVDREWPRGAAGDRGQAVPPPGSLPGQP